MSCVESLPGRWYYDPEVFRGEQETIFSREWSFIAPAAYLARRGDSVTARVAGRDLVVVNAGEAGLRGYLNACRHRGARLCSGRSSRLQRFTCPYHGWVYGLDGRLTSAPGLDLRSEVFRHGEFNLQPVRVEAWNGLVFATLDDNGPGLADWFGDLNDIAGEYPSPDEMEFHDTIETECDVNWKTYGDNSAEGYHLSLVHPSLSALLVRNRTDIRVYENGRFVGFNVTYENDGKHSPGFWVYKFPGLLMHFSMNSFNVERVAPLAANRSRMRRWFWFTPRTSVARRNAAMEQSRKVVGEDVEICRQVQQNMESGNYARGILSREREPGTIFMQQCVRRALESS